MQKITPDYYASFKCIANRCKHSCCIGWEIDVDDQTLEKYSNLDNDFSSLLKSNIEFDETPHFKLSADERCPFLNANGLCDIIINLGEHMLCQICNDHPRFRNFYDDFEEIGLGLTCEAAAKLILSKQNKTKLNLPHNIQQLPLVKFRENLFDILQDRSFSIEERVDNMLCFVGTQLPDNVDWYKEFNALEKMDSSWDTYLSRLKNGIDYTPNNSLDTAYEQLLVYLIFRHFLDSQYDHKIKERVLFATLIYKTIKTMNQTNTLDELIGIARIYSSEIEYSDENIDTILSLLN